MASEGVVIEEQFDFVAIGDGPNGELAVGRPVPFEDRRRGTPGQFGFLAGENENLQHGIVAPAGGALVEPRLFPRRQVQEPDSLPRRGNLRVSPR